MPSSLLYKGHRFPVEIISHCVWLYHRFPLSLRDVEQMMAERGVSVSYDTIHQWCRKFGQTYATGPAQATSGTSRGVHQDRGQDLLPVAGCFVPSWKIYAILMSSPFPFPETPYFRKTINGRLSYSRAQKTRPPGNCVPYHHGADDQCLTLTTPLSAAQRGPKRHRTTRLPLRTPSLSW
jgi:hypothetical protein